MAVAELWETLKHAIVAYTGLSPATFFTLLAVGGAIYYTISGFLAPPPPPRRSRELEAEAAEPLPPPVQVGEITEEELRAYDGSDPKKPLLMAIKGQIYDVTQSRMFYGPGGPYALFAGKDASRALAKLSFEPQDLNSDLTGLGPFELDALQDWEYKFMSKYVKVGTVKKTVPVTEGSDDKTAEAAETTETTERVVSTVNPETAADHGLVTKDSKSEDNVEVEKFVVASGAEPKEKHLSGQSEDAEHTVEPKKEVDDEGVKE